MFLSYAYWPFVSHLLITVYFTSPFTDWLVFLVVGILSSLYLLDNSPLLDV